MQRQPILPRSFFEILHRIADSKIGAVESAFLDSVQVTANQISVTDLRAALERHDVGAVFNSVNLNGQLTPRLKRNLERSLRSTFNSAAVAAQTAVAPRLAKLAPVPGQVIGLRFDLTNPRSILWAQNKSAKLVREVTDGTRENLRRLIARGFLEGIAPRESATDIAAVLAREVKATLGLTRGQFATWENARNEMRLYAHVKEALSEFRGPMTMDELFDVGSQFGLSEMQVNAIRQMAPISLEQAEARSLRLSDKMLRRRANVIARTETIIAANAGNRELVKQAIEQGFAPRDRMRRFWLVTPDDRTCEDICVPIPDMNPNGVGIDEPYQTPVGPVMTPGETHPACRCSETWEVLPLAVPVRPFGGDVFREAA